MAQTSIAPNTQVVSMLALIPDCSVPCFMEDIFMSGGCPMTTAADVAGCACPNIAMQAKLSACVQKSCGFLDQNKVVAFASDLCEAYPKESRTHELKAASIITIILATIFLCLRLYSRWLKTRQLYSDDAYAVVAAVLLIMVSVIILEMSLKGFGLHYWNVETVHAVALLKLFYVCQMLYVAVQIFAKIAILALYSRLFPATIHWFRWSVRGMVAFMYIHGLVFFFLIVFQCLPIQAIWNKRIENARCLPVSTAVGFTGAGLTIAEDIIILLLPLPMIWKLQMDTRKKIGVIFLISVGSFIVRIRYVVKYSNSFDATWDNVDVLKWSLIEILSACICGNLVPLRLLIEKALPSIRSFHSGHGSSRKSSSKTQIGFHDLSGSGRSSDIKKPKLTSSSLGSAPAPHLTRPQQGTLDSLRTPASAHLEKGVSYELVEDIPASKQRPRTGESIKPKLQESFTNNSERPSNESKTGLIPPLPEREHRVSGPWSCAFAFIDRR
ncbi:hypothetical protein E8E13_003086 [Curvularia kusanoi]|uniref:CFEM domain-containing protein n=1 Tax=Curvularia kusanoi TaxID=90978 RepID=A0A9P4T7S3_CURKU|nr:hypothetical protein E8E13_003086 [Curvularia kusanoi]